MHKAVNVVKLDILTVKPYIKSLLLLIPVGIILGSTNNNMLILPPMFMVWASLFVAYPFSIGEKNSLDKFLGTFSLKRKNIVSGRYLFSALSAILLQIMALAMVFILSGFIKTAIEPKAILFVTSFGLLLFSIIVSFQIPIYFKLGYTKAKMVTFLPLFAIGFFVPAISFIPPDNSIAVYLKEVTQFIENQPYIASVVFIGASAIILAISHSLSCKIYERKEF